LPQDGNAATLAGYPGLVSAVLEPVLGDTDRRRRSWPDGPFQGLEHRVGAVRAHVGRPGLTERALVVLAVFVFYHQTPNAWFIRPSDIGPDYSNPAASGLTLLLIAVAVVRVLGYFNLLIKLFRLEPAVFLFAGMALVSVLWSADPTESLRRGLVFAAVTLFAGYLVLRFSLQEIVGMLAVMFAISAVVNLAFIVAFPFYGIDDEGLWTGVLNQKNSLGYLAALGIPTLLVAARAYPVPRFIFYAAAGLEVVLLLGSDSKTMLVATAVGLILLAVYNGFRALRTLRGAVVVGLIGGTGFMAAFATVNIAPLAAWVDKDVTLTGRVPLWESLVPVIGERLWLGHGYAAAFGGWFSPIHEAWLQGTWKPNDAHNAYIQIWLELGIIGLVLFLVTYFRGVGRAIKVSALVPGAVGLWPLAVFTSALLLSVTESGMQSDSLGWTLYLVAALASAAHLKHRSLFGDGSDGMTPQPPPMTEADVEHDETGPLFVADGPGEP